MKPSWRATPLGRFVSEYTVRRIVEVLHAEGCPVTRMAVYKWVWGRNTPRPEYARALVRISGGRLDWPTVYGQREALAGEAARGRNSR